MKSPLERAMARGDMAWAIAVGGISIVTFAAALVFAWYYAATIFLIFAGALLGVALTAMSHLLQRVIGGPHGLRLLIVCLFLAAIFASVMVLGGSTIAQQATALSGTIKSQIINLKGFLESHGVDTSYLQINGVTTPPSPEAGTTPVSSPSTSPKPSALPSAGELASGGGAIVSQTLKLILGTVGAVGNLFIVLFLGLAFASQPGVYRRGLLHLSPARYRAHVEIVTDRIGVTLERWLIAQMITMSAVFAVTWIGLLLIGIPGAFILGIQAGLLAFIPTVGAILGGLIIVLASLASGWVAVGSAFALFLGVHALESYILTPIIQREAIDIPPATLFAFQILLGVVFGLWGLALALPVMAIAKVIIDDVREDTALP
ncbi:MAG: AI-2E family transporter [Bradyrhizobiaceae bacterium]|nr:MAG: AI-2E family transporter [Bradyrhizobiaceae bacterium]